MDRQSIMDAGDFSDKGIKRCLEKYFYISANPSISICHPKGGVGKSTFTVLLASYLHYTLRHDVLVVDCDYQSSDMRAVEQIPVRCRPGRRKPPFPTVATSKMPGMEIRKARPRAIRMALRIFISGV